jgi:cyclase
LAALIRDGRTMEEAVALKPTADLDPKWGNGPIRPDQIVEEVYADMKRKVR